MRRSELRMALLVGTLAVTLAGCNMFKKQPSDQTITSDIQAKLFQDPVLKTRDIRVSTQNGVVTLAGTVDTDLEKAAVERFASQEPGAKQVVDQLDVTAAATAQAEAPVAAPPPNERAKEEASSEPMRKPERAKHPRKHHTREAAATDSAPAGDESAQAVAPAPPPAAAPAPAASAPAPVVDQPPPQPAAPPPSATVTVRGGTVVTVRMVDSIDSSTGQEGQQYQATLAAPVVVDNQVVIPSGSNATVRLVRVKSSGRFEGSAQLALELVSISAQGAPYSVESTLYQQTGESRGRSTGEKVGAGGVIGGLIGAIAGGGKGAAIGAAIGAGAGAGAQAASKKSEVKVPAETKIDFTLKTPLTITLSQ
jgi:BON domain